MTSERQEAPTNAADSSPPAAPTEGLNVSRRNLSGPLLDLSGAAIQGSTEDKNPSILLPNQSNDLFHFALDIGGEAPPPRTPYLPCLHFATSLNNGRYRGPPDSLGAFNGTIRLHTFMQLYRIGGLVRTQLLRHDLDQMRVSQLQIGHPPVDGPHKRGYIMS